MLKAKWRSDFAWIYKDVDPNKVAEEISGIGNSATAEQIVERAKDENSELHKCFEWNDTIAANSWRINQARTLTYHLVIEQKETETDEDKPEIRFFVNPKNGEGYKRFERVFRQEDEYQQLLQKAMQELHAFKRKYSRLTELQDIFDLIA